MFQQFPSYSKLLSVLLVLLLSMASCKKDGDSPMDPVTPSGTVDITGSVVAEDGSFIEGALIQVNGMSTFSQERGVFKIEGVSVNEGRNFLKVTKEGYFYSGRNFYPTDSDVLQVKVQLLPKVLLGTFSSAAGGTITDGEGFQVAIPSDAIADGYQGEVRVYGRYVDPTEALIGLSVPGLEAIDASDEEGMLISYGMAHVELEDPSGNELQLADAISATLTMPVPEGMESAAPATIPLWYFDEESGIWLEDGQATLQGDVYVGDVDHFTFWNCDDFGCFRWYRVRVSCNGIPYSDMPLTFRARVGEAEVMSSTGMTDADGFAFIALPCSQTTEIYALPPGNSGLEYHIGTIEVGDQGPELSVDLTPICGPHTQVSGVVQDANGNPITNGYVYFRIGDAYSDAVFLNDQGQFTASYFYFGEEPSPPDVELVAWDLDEYAFADGLFLAFNGGSITLSSPIVIGGGSASIDGRIYVAGTEEDYFYCLDASDGSVIWAAEGPQLEGQVSPIVHDGKVCFSGLSGQFICLNAFDGSEIWSDFIIGLNSPFVEDGILYVSSLYSWIRAIDLDTGEELWEYDLDAGEIHTGPTISGDILYCGKGSSNMGLLALDKNTGNLLWDFETPAEVNSAPCVVDGKVFFGSDNQEFYALDANSGNLEWQATVDDATSLWGSPTTGDGLVYIQALSELRAFDMQSGALAWQKNILGSSGGSHPSYHNGNLYVATFTAFYCFDASDGTELWSVEGTGVGQFSTYLLAENGVVLHPDYNNPETILARNATTGALLWTSEVQDDCSSPMVWVDDLGQAHYTGLSGMEQ